MAFIMLGTGLFLSVKLGFIQITYLGRAIKYAFSGMFKKKGSRESGVTPFQSLATALGGSIGTANIAGVAGAIIVGGPGAIFWMWVAAVFGMATKFGEIVLALRYRERDGRGVWHGGAMYYIQKGLGSQFKPLAWGFAFFGLLASLVGTALVQSNTIALSAYDMAVEFGAGTDGKEICFAAGIVTAVITGMVILGGAERIGKFSEKIVPFMAMVYVAAALSVVLSNAERIGDTFALIVRSAFGLRAAVGGTAGFAFSRVFSSGVARGVYSNEAGVGSAPMAYAGSTESDPIKQGFMGLFEVFADTIVMCTLTALAILMSGVAIPYGDTTASGTTLALSAFETIFPGSISSVFLTTAILLFAFTSLVGWSLYGLRCTEYLFGNRASVVFRIVYLMLIPIGAVMGVSSVWLIGESLNYMMALPNLIALFLLSNEIKGAVLQYKMFEKKRQRVYNNTTAYR